MQDYDEIYPKCSHLTEIELSVSGARHITLDNSYQSPELCYVLRERFGIFSTGTICTNRKGWDKNIMDLPSNSDCGSYKFGYDDVLQILCVQWKDSKVVNVVSSVVDNNVETVQCQIGSKQQNFLCPTVLRKYQSFMFGVDKGNQLRAAGGGFALKAHFKKWYKKGFFAILDMMLLNAYIAWNILQCLSQ